LYINNLIAHYVCNYNENNFYKIPLACFLKHKIFYVDDIITINTKRWSKIINVNLHYDFKKIKLNKLCLNIVVSSTSYNSITSYNFILHNTLFTYTNHHNEYVIFYGMAHFMFLLIQYKDLEKNNNPIVEEITFKFTIGDLDNSSIFNILKSKMIKVIIPKDKIIIMKFMNETLYLFGLDKQFKEKKSIKKMLCNESIHNNSNFITIIKDIQLFPTTHKDFKFYCF
jgi:hypothetical protein